MSATVRMQERRGLHWRIFGCQTHARQPICGAGQPTKCAPHPLKIRIVRHQDADNVVQHVPVLAVTVVVSKALRINGGAALDGDRYDELWFCHAFALLE